MRKIAFLLAVTLTSAAVCSAQSRAMPSTANLRFSEQISNAPAGTCGCFSMEGLAGDMAWNLYRFDAKKHSALLSGVADLSVEHAGSVNGAPYGLTLTTLAFGPRYQMPVRKADMFIQTLLGFTHGSNSQFPVGATLQSSATSFAADLGGGIEYPLKWHHTSLRIIQAEYTRTDLPNNSSNWQSNLRLGTGITFHFR